jgi:hypothetical protein
MAAGHDLRHGARTDESPPAPFFLHEKRKGKKMKKRYVMNGIGFLLALLASCPLDTDNVPKSELHEPDAPPSAPVLTGGPAVSYVPGSYAPSVTFVFDTAVNGEAEGWVIAGNETAELTATPAPETELTPGVLCTFKLTAANVLDETKTVAVGANVMPVSGPFVRPDAGEAVYTVFWYDGASGAAGLLSGTGGDEPDWFFVEEEALRNMFNAVYAPNAPGTADSIEPGKQAAAYTPEISETVLSLFNITVGSTDAGDRVEIGGADLLAASAPVIDEYHPVVIDIGIPGTSNGGLPAFHVRAGALGTAEVHYGHIRLRVNQGAGLVIEADNTGYSEGITDWACPHGNLQGGTVEVAGGGWLRNGAYRGFPLGKGSIIIARLGSRLATGPESSFSPSAPGYDAELDAHYAGWLIGHAGDGAALCWGAGDQNGSFIEIRDIPRPGDGADGGTLAFDVNLTLRKPLALRYNVWFVNSPTLTIDAADGPAIDGHRGLIAEDARYKLYGTFFQTGGQNPARPAAKIIVMPGSGISRSALSPDGEGFVKAEGSGLTINNRGAAGGAVETGYGRDSIAGYCNWDAPQP